MPKLPENAACYATVDGLRNGTFVEGILHQFSIKGFRSKFQDGEDSKGYFVLSCLVYDCLKT